MGVSRKYINNQSLSKVLELLKRNKILIFTILFALIGVFLLFISRATTPIYSIASGDWSNPATWSNASVPKTGESVVINNGHTIEFSGSLNELTGVTVEEGATLQLDPTKSTTLISSGNIIVEGSLISKPSNQTIIHEIKFVNIDETKFVGGGMDPVATDVGLWVMGDGILDIAGTSKTSWTYLSGGVNAGSTQVVLSEAPVGWLPGDEIVISPTENTEVGDDFWQGFDENTIKSVSGSTVTLEQPLKYNHPEVNNKWTAEIMNLTRNVLIEGTGDATVGPANNGRTHVLIRSTKPQTVKYAQLRHVGPRHGVPGETTDILGRYGLHFHHSGEGVRGSIVEGVVVRDSGAHAFVPHGSHGVIMKDSIAYNGWDDAFWWDSPAAIDDSSNNSNDTLWDHNIAALRKSDPSYRGYSLAGFLLGAGTGNTITRSVAVGIQGNTNSNGFHWPSKANHQPNTWNFGSDNIAHNNKSDGLFVWQNLANNVHDVSNFAAYHNGLTGIDHGAYTNSYQYRNMELYKNGLSDITLHALPANLSPDKSRDDGYIIAFENFVASDNVRIVKHTSPSDTNVLFKDCSVPTILVDEESSSGQYDFVNCNLEYEDFQLINQLPDSLIRVQDVGKQAYSINDQGQVANISDFYTAVATPDPNPNPDPDPDPTPDPEPNPDPDPDPTPDPEPNPDTSSYACTELIGFSQTGQWFSASDLNWQARIQSGSGVEKWADPNYLGWTEPMRNEICAKNQVDRAIFNISGPGRSLDLWVSDIQTVLGNIRSKYTNVKTIMLQPVVGAPDELNCDTRASDNHPDIDAAINQVVSSDSGNARVGASPEVGSCSHFSDGLGHLSQEGSEFVANQIESYYDGSDGSDPGTDPGTDPSDVTPPSTIITSPLDGATVSGNVDVTVSATDDKGITKVDLLVDGILLASDTNEPYSLQWDSSTGDATDGLHELRAIAYDAAGNSSSDSINVQAEKTTDGETDTVPPTTPVNFRMTTRSESHIGLAWEPSTDDSGDITYHVYRNSKILATTKDAFYTDNNVNASTTYKYSVIAVDPSNNQSEASATITVQTLKATDTQAPTTPTNLVANAEDASRVNLSWNASTDDSGEVTYYVYRDGVIILTTTSTNYSDQSVIANTTYTYTVRAFDQFGNISQPSNAATVTIPGASESDTTPPTAPRNLSISGTTRRQVNLKWLESTDDNKVSHYNIYRNGRLLSNVTTTSFGDGTVSNDNRYTYYVTAVDNSRNESNSSNKVQIFFRKIRHIKR